MHLLFDCNHHSILLLLLLLLVPHAVQPDIAARQAVLEQGQGRDGDELHAFPQPHALACIKSSTRASSFSLRHPPIRVSSGVTSPDLPTPSAPFGERYALSLQGVVLFGPQLPADGPVLALLVQKKLCELLRVCSVTREIRKGYVCSTVLITHSERHAR
jgi:hypothetical protein